MTAETDSAANTLVAEAGIALREGRDKDAEASFRAALDVSPDFVPANYNLGLMQLERGRAAEGLPHLQRAAKAQPTLDTLTSLGKCFETLGNAEQATRCYRPVLAKTPQNSDLWARYASLKETLGEKADAREAYENALQYNPRHTQAAIKLGWILWRDSPAKAINTLRAAVNAVGENLSDRIKLLSVMVLFEEWIARINKGLPP
ncbi:MAG: tetratricopeptide repeat protein [Alphaproteobacteria bacterium]|nr:tetratricopeptide repeat protein [Alphaproteobacteria bacterium]